MTRVLNWQFGTINSITSPLKNQMKVEKVKDSVVTAEEADKLYPYCYDCGEDRNFAYIDQYACGEHYKCKSCGKEICFTTPTNR